MYHLKMVQEKIGKLKFKNSNNKNNYDRSQRVRV